MSSIPADLRRLPWWIAAPVVALAVVVLALRIVGLLVALVVTYAERADTAVGRLTGISPLGASTVLLPPDLTNAFRGGAR